MTAHVKLALALDAEIKEVLRMLLSNDSLMTVASTGTCCQQLPTPTQTVQHAVTGRMLCTWLARSQCQLVQSAV